MRDLGDVCGARNTQFEQEFLGLFRAETVSAYDWRDRICDFCVADYLAELDMVHVMRYSTRFSLTCAARAHALPTSDNPRRENALWLSDRECHKNSYAMIIREICSQLVGQGVVSMLFALLRRNVFQARCITFRLSDRGPATEVMFACVFGHGCNSRFEFVVARTQSYLTGRGADFEQVLVSTASR
jgi:hypothetical protein